jgi:hypothetical protein
MDPINYLGMMGGLGPSYQDTQLQQQQVRQNANILAAQKAKADADAQARVVDEQQRIQYQAAVQRAIQQPTAQNWAALQLLNPDAHQAIKSGWEALDKDSQASTLRETAAVYGALRAGKPELAKTQLQQRIDADKAAGQDTSHDQQILDLIGEDVNAAIEFVTPILASIAGPEKMAEAFSKIGETARADELQPSAVAKASAEASKATTEAAYAPQVIQSDLASEASTRQRQAAQTANEIESNKLGWAKLNLDADALATNTQLKLQELGQRAGALDAGATSEINKAVASSVQNQALADRASELAAKFQATDIGNGGWMASAREAWKGAWGSQNPVTGLRTAFQGLINSQAIKNLPPGPATDKDILLAKQGFPPASAGKEYIVSFLRGMAKMQTLAAQADDRRANWIAANKSLAPARQDIDVGGVRIPAGTTFSEFNRNAGKIAKQGEVNPALEGIFQRYGGQ